ncbi:uncharacterized protein MONOS_3497 [Monocercomonoides exilis]|uniref:uncharacterized protein n=1 Tax=Monocercomonoides exilis TaxID=2049356 RepID=UPI0035598C9A|nr:hypothetical protein MONOS_3497 [Monocercomonoides exilis]|eukprot:MONOS_3497.1-p1 / transcript=MONOS_3497.1 / gene=MONOS_3497 / organism=Monocercomonoides_exilis_PA203 / gene_product=unspecified product / transcript_product=unspecified product / location=Mono_scaffold00083:11298-11793(-) / protein_length=110 / sequence_SO=supercontig / SO=protein_coding / is_pseudo=false
MTQKNNMYHVLEEEMLKEEKAMKNKPTKHISRPRSTSNRPSEPKVAKEPVVEKEETTKKEKAQKPKKEKRASVFNKHTRKLWLGAFGLTIAAAGLHFYPQIKRFVMSKL